GGFFNGRNWKVSKPKRGLKRAPGVSKCAIDEAKPRQSFRSCGAPAKFCLPFPLGNAGDFRVTPPYAGGFRFQET
ncbi:MAG: hypothetical protein ACXU8O_07865, partial [Asticcacaulis sp.]